MTSNPIPDRRLQWLLKQLHTARQRRRARRRMIVLAAPACSLLAVLAAVRWSAQPPPGPHRPQPATLAQRDAAPSEIPPLGPARHGIRVVSTRSSPSVVPIFSTRPMAIPAASDDALLATLRTQTPCIMLARIDHRARLLNPCDTHADNPQRLTP